MRNKKNGGAWTVAQAARAWGMSEGTLRRRVRSGHIEALSQSRAGLLIEAATVQALLAARWCSREEDEAQNARKVVCP
jgi:transposase-like protein